MIVTQSIFGIESPKVVFETATILLENSIILNDRSVKDVLIHESILDRHREIVVKGIHWLFEINLFLFKYGVDAQAKYDELKAMERGYVDQLFRRRDGSPIKYSTPADIRFVVDEITEYYIDRWDYPDVLNIRFLSENYINIQSSAIAP